MLARPSAISPPPRVPQVLRFFGYYQEPVPESPIENHRVRKVRG